MEIAIIDANILSCMGLEQILQNIIPMASIVTFSSFEQLVISQPERFGHYFVSSSIYFENANYFARQPHRAIVLVHGDNYPRLSGLLTLNVCQSEKDLVKDILSLRNTGHRHGGHPGKMPDTCHAPEPAYTLSAREAEVAILLAKGHINKEIADRLNISITTVISHRKNIMDKLRARSLADIIVYVVTNGLLSLEEL